MNTDFARNLVMLRKEKKLSQKQVSKDLGLSQALLSHYEKGIRECGLAFVVKTAEYFDVSCDFLLGLSDKRNPEKAEEKSGEPINTSERKSITGSVNIIFAILRKINNKYLTTKVTEYLSASVYPIFRLLYSANPDNQSDLFELDDDMYDALCNSKRSISKARCRTALSGKAPKEVKHIPGESLPRLSQEIVKNEYTQYSAALFEMIKTAENAEE